MKFVLLLCLGASAWASPEEVQISVKGMVCGFCARGIAKKFARQSAVKSVRVSLEDEIVTLVLKEGAELQNAAIGDLIRDSGFEPGPIRRLASDRDTVVGAP